MNKKVLAKLTAHVRKSNSAHTGWSTEQGGHARRRPELKLAGGYATAVKGAKQGSRVRLHVEGIVTGIETSPKQKPNMVIQVEKVRQS